MKESSTLFLKFVIVLMALAVAVVCLFVLPLAMVSDNTGYYRPILIGMYVPVIPFLIALRQGMNLLTYIDSNTAFSPLSVNALKRIKYCAVIISLMYGAGMPYIFYAADKDDAPGVIVIGLVIIAASFVIAVFAAVLQKLIHNGIEIKSENDLTV